MGNYYLAIDIGASSGRHIVGSIEDGKMKLEEVYRFDNGMHEKGDNLVWDMDHLFAEIVNGMKKCAEIGKIPSTMAIDTWGVDYVLIDSCEVVKNGDISQAEENVIYLVSDPVMTGPDIYIEYTIIDGKLITKSKFIKAIQISQDNIKKGIYSFTYPTNLKTEQEINDLEQLTEQHIIECVKKIRSGAFPSLAIQNYVDEFKKSPEIL